MQTDYKAHELNLYSNNSVGRLKFQDGKGTGLGPGFGQNQEYIFAKYTDDAKGQYQWPVCIPELHTIDNSTGYVIGVGWAIYDGKEKLNDEKTRALGVESGLRTDLEAYHAADSKAIADEAAARAQADNGNWATILIVESESKGRDTKLSDDLATEVSDRKGAVSAVDGKLTVERTRALDAEAVVQANVVAEEKERKSEVARLDGRINFITNNADGAAIDSLSEIVAQFSQNGQGYASRLTYLEAVVSALVAKTQ
jgi:hypothetical protein